MMIKNDINLLPAKKRLPAYITVGVPFGIFLLVLLLTAGIYFPSASLNNKKDNLEKLKTELSGYEDVNAQYIQKLQELQTLQGSKANFDDFFSGENHVLEITNMLYEIIPEEVTITQYNLNETGIVISGTALNDLIIADLEDTFWSTEKFSEIDLGTISGLQDERSFVFTLSYFNEASDGGKNQ